MCRGSPPPLQGFRASVRELSVSGVRKGANICDRGGFLHPFFGGCSSGQRAAPSFFVGFCPQLIAGRAPLERFCRDKLRKSGKCLASSQAANRRSVCNYPSPCSASLPTRLSLLLVRHAELVVILPEPRGEWTPARGALLLAFLVGKTPQVICSDPHK